jgi:hypothetical protein
MVAAASPPPSASEADNASANDPAAAAATALAVALAARTTALAGTSNKFSGAVLPQVDGVVPAAVPAAVELLGRRGSGASSRLGPMRFGPSNQARWRAREDTDG